MEWIKNATYIFLSISAILSAINSVVDIRSKTLSNKRLSRFLRKLDHTLENTNKNGTSNSSHS